MARLSLVSFLFYPAFFYQSWTCYLLTYNVYLSHYIFLIYFSTKLPLRYVYLAVDDNGSRQDPRDVTQKWEEEQGLGMSFWVVNVSEFITPNNNTNSTATKTTTTTKEEAHHDFIHRQRAFITECTRFLQQQGVHWTTYMDTDEFIVINHLGHEDYDNDNNNTTTDQFRPSREEFRSARRDLPPMETQPTVLQVLKNSTITTITTTQYPACISMPRLLYGALETTTCPEARETLDFAQAHFPRRYSDLSTLRFEQHARKGDFQKSRWGKVLMNVSGVPQELLDSDNNNHSPRNIHRPWKEVCGPAAVHFPDAIFYVNHYIGSWERYSSRHNDARRNRDEWEQRAYLSDGRSCDKQIHEWLPEFVEQVGGLETAKRLLGH